MGSKRMGLGRMEALLEAVDRDLDLANSTLTNCIITTSAAVTFTGAHAVSGTGVHTVYGHDMYNGGIHTTMFGLAPQWNTNFGGALLEGEDPGTSAANVLTSGVTAVNLAKALAYIAGTTAVPTAAHAATVFGGTGVTGVDIAIGTTASPGTTPTVTQRIARLTGGVSGTVVMAAGADMAGAGDECLILFTGNTFASSGVLKFTLNTDNELEAAANEVWVTGDGTDVTTQPAACTNLDAIIILTDTGDCTILAGSYIYLHADDASDNMQMKACIRTSGGTIAVTYAA